MKKVIYIRVKANRKGFNHFYLQKYSNGFKCFGIVPEAFILEKQIGFKDI